MKVTVIGYWGGFPGVNEATSGYLLESNHFNLLVDCGSGVISQLQHYIKIEELDATILSHYHHDHVADVGVLQYGRLVNYHLGHVKQLLPIYGHTFDMEGFNRLSKANATEGTAYDPQNTLNIGPFSITFLKTKHPAICFAMRISDGESTIVYTADSSYISEFTSFAKGADLLINESSFYANQDGSNVGHMNSKEAASIAAEANVKKLLLTHLPHFGNHQQLIEEAEEVYNGKIELASSGWTWEPN